SRRKEDLASISRLFPPPQGPSTAGDVVDEVARSASIPDPAEVAERRDAATPHRMVISVPRDARSLSGTLSASAAGLRSIPPPRTRRGVLVFGAVTLPLLGFVAARLMAPGGTGAPPMTDAPRSAAGTV